VHRCGVLSPQAGHGDPVTVDAVVSAYFKQQSVDETTPSGKVAYTKLVEKLSTELDWLPALEQFLLKHKTGQAQGPQGEDQNGCIRRGCVWPHTIGYNAFSIACLFDAGMLTDIALWMTGQVHAVICQDRCLTLHLIRRQTH
jgi:hypothetical protein